jgi:hypothetical protein
MIALHRLIRVELLKLRNTLALFVALVLPGVIAALFALMAADRGKPFTVTGSEAWLALFQTNAAGWTGLGLNLFVALEASLVVGIEHEHGGWKRLLALPLGIGRLLVAKSLIVLGLVAVSLVSLWCWTTLFGNALVLFVPKLGLQHGMPGLPAWQMMLTISIASSLIVVLHVAIATWFRSIAVSLGVAIGAMLGLVLAAGSKWMAWYPWFYPLRASQPNAVDALFQSELWLPLLVVPPILCLVILLWRRRDVP